MLIQSEIFEILESVAAMNRAQILAVYLHAQIAILCRDSELVSQSYRDAWESIKAKPMRAYLVVDEIKLDVLAEKIDELAPMLESLSLGDYLQSFGMSVLPGSIEDAEAGLEGKDRRVRFYFGVKILAVELIFVGATQEQYPSQTEMKIANAETFSKYFWRRYQAFVKQNVQYEKLLFSEAEMYRYWERLYTYAMETHRVVITHSLSDALKIVETCALTMEDRLQLIYAIKKSNREKHTSFLKLRKSYQAQCGIEVDEANPSAALIEFNEKFEELLLLLRKTDILPIIRGLLFKAYKCCTASKEIAVW